MGCRTLSSGPIAEPNLFAHLGLKFCFIMPLPSTSLTGSTGARRCDIIAVYCHHRNGTATDDSSGLTDSSSLGSPSWYKSAWGLPVPKRTGFVMPWTSPKEPMRRGRKGECMKSMRNPRPFDPELKALPVVTISPFLCSHFNALIERWGVQRQLCFLKGLEKPKRRNENWNRKHCVWATYEPDSATERGWWAQR